MWEYTNPFDVQANESIDNISCWLLEEVVMREASRLSMVRLVYVHWLCIGSEYALETTTWSFGSEAFTALTKLKTLSFRIFELGDMKACVTWALQKVSVKTADSICTLSRFLRISLHYLTYPRTEMSGLIEKAKAGAVPCASVYAAIYEGVPAAVTVTQEPSVCSIISKI